MHTVHQFHSISNAIRDNKLTIYPLNKTLLLPFFCEWLATVAAIAAVTFIIILIFYFSPDSPEFTFRTDTVYFCILLFHLFYDLYFSSIEYYYYLILIIRSFSSKK